MQKKFNGISLLIVTLICGLIGMIPIAAQEKEQEKKTTGQPAKPAAAAQDPAKDDEPVAVTEKAKTAPVVIAPVLTESQFGNFRYPTINNKGEIAFLGLFSSAKNDNRGEQRLFYQAEGGGWKSILASGEIAADSKDKLTNLGVPHVNELGEATFSAGFVGAGESEVAAQAPVHDSNDPAAHRPYIPKTGLYKKTAAGLQTLLKMGGEVPNMPSYFTGISNVSANNKGTTAFIGTYSEPDGRGLFFHANGKLQLMARSGQRIGVNETGTFSEHYYPSVINDRDEVAFLGRSGDKSGIFMASSRGIEIIAFGGRPSPIKGANYLGFGNRTPGLNNKGEVVFVGFFDGPESGRGLFMKGAGPARLVLRSGDKIPGTTYNFTDFSSPVINDRGDIAFIGNYGGRSRGLFLKTAKGVEPVALIDQRIPGGDKDEVFNNFTQPSINARGEMVFYAQWKTPKTGVEVGVFWRDQQGNLKLLFKRGDEMPK